VDKSSYISTFAVDPPPQFFKFSWHGREGVTRDAKPRTSPGYENQTYARHRAVPSFQLSAEFTENSVRHCEKQVG